jgi:hypothetical protein
MDDELDQFVARDVQVFFFCPLSGYETTGNGHMLYLVSHAASHVEGLDRIHASVCFSSALARPFVL